MSNIECRTQIARATSIFDIDFAPNGCCTRLINSPRPAQFGGSRPRVCGALFPAGANGLFGNLRVRARAQAGAKGGFYQAILAAMDADDGGPTARRDHRRNTAY